MHEESVDYNTNYLMTICTITIYDSRRKFAPFKLEIALGLASIWLVSSNIITEEDFIFLIYLI